MMTIYAILVFIISLNSIIGQTDKLNVGIILDVDDKISGKTIEILLKNARTLRSQIEILDERNVFGVFQKTCNLLPKAIAAVIDVSSKYLSKQVSSILNKFQIPHFMGQCQVGEKATKDVMGIAMHPDCKQYSEIIYKYISEIEKWSEVMIIYSANSYFLKFQHLFNSLDIRFKVRKWSHNNVVDNKLFFQDLSKSGLYTNFLVDIPFWQIQSFLTMALLHNKNGARNSFIFTDLDTHHFDLRILPVDSNFNIKTFSLLNPIDTYDTKVTNTTMKDLVSKINKIENEAYNLNIKSGLMVRSGILVNSVNLLVRAIDRIKETRTIDVSALQCTQNNVSEIGSSLMAEIKKIKPIDQKIESLGDLNQKSMFNLSVMKWTENGFQEIDSWLNNQFVASSKNLVSESVKPLKLGAMLRVTTIETRPFVFYKGDRPKDSIYDSNINAWDGFCIDLLKEISSDLGIKFSIKLVKDSKFGIVIEDVNKVKKWTGMIGELISQDADLAVAPITVTDKRATVVDFSEPFMNVSLTVLYFKPALVVVGVFSFLTPFSPTLWFYIIFAYAIASLLIFAVVLITPQECRGCIPRSHSTKLASVMWWFFTIVIICTYTANMAANFIEGKSRKMDLSIKSFEDLSRQIDIGYGTISGGSTYSFFEKSTIPAFQNMFDFMKSNPDFLVKSVQRGVNKVLYSKGKYAFILESAMNDYYVSNDCRLMRIADLIDSKNYAIAFPKSSVLRNPVSLSISKLRSMGKLSKLKNKWFKTSSNLSRVCEERINSASGLYSNYLLGVIYMLWIVLIIAVLIAIIELYGDFRIQNNHTKGPFYLYLKNKIIVGWKQRVSFKVSKRVKVTLNDTEKIKTADKKDDYEISESLRKTSSKDQASSNPQIVIVPDSGPPITTKT